MRILIAGGTGFIGRALHTALAQRGDEVLVLSRSPGPEGARLNHRHSRRITWAELRQQGLPICDAVVNLSGANITAKYWSKKFKKEIYTSRIETTRQLALAINQSDTPPKVFINASAVGWYPTDDRKIFTENEVASNSFLGMVSQHWEAAASLKTGGLTRLVILRFGMVLGVENPVIPLMIRLFRWGLGAKIGSGQHPFSWVHIDDVVRMILFALDRSSVEGIYNCVSPQLITHAEFTKTLSQLLHRPAFFSIPKWLLTLFLGERATLLTEGSYVIPQRAIYDGFEFRYPDLSSALKNLIDTCHSKLKNEI